MKLAISASGRSLDDPVDSRFGRCPYFIIVDGDMQNFEVIENPNKDAQDGAGIQSAQLVAGIGVEAVLTGHCGPKAFQILEAGGIDVFIGMVGSIREAVEQCIKGDLSAASRPDVGTHFKKRI